MCESFSEVCGEDGEVQGFLCKLCTSKKKVVQCPGQTHGHSGKLSHLKFCHKAVHAALPGGRRKRSRPDGQLNFTREEVVCWMARRCHPHEELNDPFIKQIAKQVGLTVQSIIDETAVLNQRFTEALVDSSRQRYFSLAIDGGQTDRQTDRT